VSTAVAAARPAASLLQALPGRWREVGGLDDLVRLNMPARTAGMVMVGCAREDWRRRPELRFQVWPDDLVQVAPVAIVNAAS
jgi:hypothetical protein